MKGWSREALESMFIFIRDKILTRQKQVSTAEEDDITNKEYIIVYLEYHQDDIPKKQIRNILSECCAKLLSKSICDGGLGIKK